MMYLLRKQGSHLFSMEDDNMILWSIKKIDVKIIPKETFQDLAKLAINKKNSRKIHFVPSELQLTKTRWLSPELTILITIWKGCREESTQQILKFLS